MCTHNVVMCQIRVALFVAVSTSSLISRSNSASESCTTDECTHVANYFLEHMDRSTDPCNDFYDFACGQFSKSTDENSNVFDYVSNVTKYRLRKIIMKSIQDNDPIPLQKAKMFHDTCINDETYKQDPIQPIHKKIKNLGGWPIQENSEDTPSADYLIGLVQKARELGFDTNALFTVNILPNVRNTSERILVITPPPLVVPVSNDETPSKQEEKLVTDYCTLMLMIGFQFAQYERSDIPESVQAELFSKIVETLRFELLLAKIFPRPYVDKYVLDTYDIQTITEIQTSYPFLNWLEYLRAILGPNVTVDSNEKVVVSGQSYFSKLQNVYSKLNDKRAVKNYLVWRYVLFSLRVSLALIPESLRSKSCLSITLTGFEPVIAAKYIKKYITTPDRQTVIDIVNEIKKVMYRMFQTFDWIDPSTKEVVLGKIESIVMRVAYTDDMIDSEASQFQSFETLDVSPNDYFSSVMYLIKLSLDKIASTLHEPIDRNQWPYYISTLVANAFYIPIDNSISIPAAVLQKELFSPDRPLYLNYGSIGFIVGHELSHAFDNTGRFYDKYGNHNLALWDSRTTSEYEDREKCFIDQYDNYMLGKTGMHLNGSKTLSENMADNQGITMAYRAYKTWIKKNGEEEQLPKMNYTPEQTFWISMANVWCSKIVNDTMLKKLSKIDPHAPAKFRVIGMVSNQDTFAKDFQCSSGSPMNPKKKCTFY